MLVDRVVQPPELTKSMLWIAHYSFPSHNYIRIIAQLMVSDLVLQVPPVHLYSSVYLKFWLVWVKIDQSAHKANVW